MKVKLRVPLSSAPRESSSPLSNPLRASAPDYSDDDDEDGGDQATASAHARSHRSGLAGNDDQDQQDEDDEGEQDEDEEEEEEADELDELEEEDQQEGTATPLSTTVTPTKRSRITLKSRAKGSTSGGGKTNRGAATMGTASPASSQTGPYYDEDGRSQSPMSSSETARQRTSSGSKRPSSTRVAQAQALSVEELDALPAAKRRKTAKARGAAGPGRGWRKGLTKGQKPVYELPAHGKTPSTFADTASESPSEARELSAAPVAATTTTTSITSKSKSKASSSTTAAASAAAKDKLQRSSPAVVAATKKENVPTSLSSQAGKASSSTAASSASAAVVGGGSSSAVKIVSGPGGSTFVGDLSAKAGTAKNPGFRYPPLPSSRGGPAVQPLAKIPVAFQTVIPLEKNKREPRRWQKGKREVLSMGGRPWSVQVWYGGDDRGYEKKVDGTGAAGTTATTTNTANAANANANNNTGSSAAAGDGGAKAAGKALTPVPAAANEEAEGQGRGSTSSPGRKSNGATNLEDNKGSSTPTPSVADSTSKEPRNAHATSPLPPPKHLNSIKDVGADWRGQSPAFLFGGR